MRTGWCFAIKQWGYTSENNKTIKFPISFTSIVYSIIATIANTYGDARPSAENATKSGFLIACRNGGGAIIPQIPVYWAALGK